MSPVRRIWKLATGSTSIYFIATAVSRAGALFLIPLYTRQLSIAEFGDYSLAQTVTLLLPTLLSLGTVAAVGRFYFDGEDIAAARRKAGGAARASIVLCVCLACPLQLLAVIFGEPGRQLAGRWELSCMVWASVGTLVSSIPVTFLRAAQRPILTVVLQLLQFLSILVAGIILVVVLHRGTRGAIEALATAGIVSGLVGLVYVFVALPGKLTITVLREAISFSLPFVPHLAARQIEAASDRWVMKGIGHEVDLGIYSLSNQLTTPTQMVVQAWNEADSPRQGEIYRASGLAAVAARCGKLVLVYATAAIIPGAMTVAGAPLLRLFVGQRFANAMWPVPVLLAIIVIEAGYLPSVNVLFYANRTRLIPVITVGVAIINVIANIILVPLFGIWGALGARAISSSTRTTAMLVAARRCVPARLRYKE